MSLAHLGFYRELSYGDPDGESIHRTLKLSVARKARVVAYDCWLPDDFVVVATDSDPPDLNSEQLAAIDERLLPGVRKPSSFIAVKLERLSIDTPGGRHKEKVWSRPGG